MRLCVHNTVPLLPAFASRLRKIMNPPIWIPFCNADTQQISQYLPAWWPAQPGLFKWSHVFVRHTKENTFSLTWLLGPAFVLEAKFFGIMTQKINLQIVYNNQTLHSAEFHLININSVNSFLARRAMTPRPSAF